MSRPRYGWWGYVKSMARQYPARSRLAVSGPEAREQAAVETAIQYTMGLPDGEERMRLVRRSLLQHTHTLEGAAMEVPCSYATARRWHKEFLQQIAKAYGLLQS